MKVERFAEVNGTRLCYDVAGSGPPLVLVHGFTLDKSMWDDQFEMFAERYKVIRYDLRGHGKSAVPDVERFYHADDLKGLLDHLRVKRAHMIGLSLGSAIVTEFTLAYPQMASTLVPVDPVLWGYAWSPEFESSLGKVQEVGSLSGADAARSLWLHHPLFAPALEKPEVAPRLTRIISNYSGWHWTHNDPGLLPDPLAIQRLEQVAVPTLVVLGERDLLDFHMIADMLAKRIPRARKVVLPGAGHMSNMEDPTGFNEAVLDFLQTIEISA